ncbi:MAG: hypothetical protein JWP16_1801 [Alphaproteobacteria bacterium]|nr:hypothetical protein [Alphaproteobacteria bacterium]
MEFETVAPLLICAVLVAAAMAAMALRARVPARWREDEPAAPLTAHFLTVMTSLLLGLMLNSARTTFEAVNHNIQTAATRALLLDRALRRYGPEADPARHELLAFVSTVRAAATGAAGPQPLDAVEDDLGALAPADARHAALQQDAQQQVRALVETRLALVEQGEGQMPRPLIAMLGLWLAAIFSMLGYRAASNPIMRIKLVVTAILVSCAIYLMLDMDIPYSGPIQVSWQPLVRAAAAMQP